MTDIERKAGDAEEVDRTKEFLNTFFGKGRYSPDPTDQAIRPQHFVARGESEDIPVSRRIRFDPSRDIDGEVVEEIEK